MNGIPKVSLLKDIICQQLLSNQPIRKMAVSQQNLAASNQVSALSESLATQLQLLRNYMSSSLSTPSASHGPNAVDAVFGTLSIGVIIAGGIILYPYFTLFQWVNKKKKAAIKNIFGGKTK